MKYSHRRVLLLFVPITLISTPLGQLVADEVPTQLVQAIAGVLVTFVAFWELYCKRKWFMGCCVRKKDGETKEDDDDDDDDDIKGEKTERSNDAIDSSLPQMSDPELLEAGGQERSVQSQPSTIKNETSTNSKVIDSISCNNMSAVEGEPSSLHTSSGDKAINTINNNTSTVGEEKNSSSSTTNNTSSKAKTIETSKSNTSTEEQLRIGPNKATFLTLLAGGASGFLGGMVAIRGPPLIFYFLHPPHPISFNKNSQRATGVVIMFCNVTVRIITYLVYTFSDATGTKNVFVKEDWRLYLSVIVFSIVGGLVGSKLFEYTKDSKDVIRGVLAIFLLICGVSLLFSGFQ